VKFGKERFDVSAVPRFQCALERLDVLLRHRPPSIPRRGAWRSGIRLDEPGPRERQRVGHASARGAEAPTPTARRLRGLPRDRSRPVFESPCRS
jgi:hypothetical protein